RHHLYESNRILLCHQGLMFYVFLLTNHHRRLTYYGVNLPPNQTNLSNSFLHHRSYNPYPLQDILQFRQLPIVYPIYIYFSVESFELLHLDHSLISLPFSKIESIVLIHVVFCILKISWFHTYLYMHVLIIRIIFIIYCHFRCTHKNLVGFMRATEVTINNKDNSYNQHMHVLVCMEPTYFKNTENYVKQKQWIQFWKKAMKLDYDPNVKVQMIRPKNKYKSDIQSAIDETAKYPVKDTDFMTDDEEKNLKRLSDLEEG